MYNSTQFVPNNDTNDLMHLMIHIKWERYYGNKISETRHLRWTWGNWWAGLGKLNPKPAVGEVDSQPDLHLRTPERPRDLYNQLPLEAEAGR